MTAPSYLRHAAAQYAANPKETNLAWFRNAKTGLFLHYGLYSLLGRPDYLDVIRQIGIPNPVAYARTGREWAQYGFRIPVSAYERLAERFRPDRFDAEAIVQFAKSCGMDYINLTTRHHDSFCLWDASGTPFQCMRATGRDLVRELYDACEKQGLALFLYYSHGRDWRHPHAPNNDEWGGKARPEYAPPEPSYAYGEAHDVGLYADFVKQQILELLARFPHVAGIWLDGIAVAQNGPAEQMRIPELYAAIRAASPHALIAYKQGITGTEDFFAPEHGLPEPSANANRRGRISQGALIEVCTTMSNSWGYLADGVPKTEAQLLEAIDSANQHGYRLLINSGPMDDGALNPAETSVMARAFQHARG